MSLSLTEDCLQACITWNSYSLMYIKCCVHLTHVAVVEDNFSGVYFMWKAGIRHTYRVKLWWRRFTLEPNEIPLAKMTLSDSLLRAFSETSAFTAETIIAAFHNRLSDKFKPLSHVLYTAYTTVHVFSFRSLCTCFDITVRNSIMLFFPASLDLKF